MYQKNCFLCENPFEDFCGMEISLGWYFQTTDGDIKIVCNDCLRKLRAENAVYKQPSIAYGKYGKISVFVQDPDVQIQIFR